MTVTARCANCYKVHEVEVDPSQKFTQWECLRCYEKNSVKNPEPELPPEPESTGIIAKLNMEFISHQAKMDQMKAEQEVVVQSLSEYDAQIAELEAQMKALRKNKAQAETKRFDLHKAMQGENSYMEQLKRRLAQEAENERIAALAAVRRGTIEELTKDAKWRARAKEHQMEGALFLSASQRAICADQMGLGKTLQAVMYLDMLEATGDGGKRVLIVCPKDIIKNFEKEFNNWAPERAIVRLGGIKGGSKAILEEIEYVRSLSPEFTFLINYEMLARSEDVVIELIMSLVDTVICDEAHRIKEIDKPTYKRIEQIVMSANMCPICFKPTTPDRMPMIKPDVNVYCPNGHGVVKGQRSVINWLPMTGTPVLNRPEEIYPLLHLANEKAFPRQNDFLYDYCTKDPYTGKYIWRAGGEAALARKIKGNYIRRTRQDAGIVLPPQEITVHTVEIDQVSYPKQYKILKDLARNAIEMVEEKQIKSFFHMLPYITRQRQAAVWPGGIWMDERNPITGDMERIHVGAGYQESIKLDKACELMEEFEEAGERYIVFSQFLEALKELKRRRGDSVAELNGGVPSYKRDQIASNFDRDMAEKPKWAGVLSHYTVGGIGLNLTAATQVIVIDEQWNPGMASQAFDRVNRMGQTEETGVHIIRLANSFDEKMARLIEHKRGIVEGFDNAIAFESIVGMFDEF